MRHRLDAAYHGLNDRRLLRRRVGVDIAMDMARIAFRKAAAVFPGTDKFLKCPDSGLPIHRVGVGIGVRCKRRRVDSHRLVLVPQFEVTTETAPVYRVACRPVGAVLGKLDVPPPFLAIVQATAPNRIIQCRQPLGRHGNIRCRPAERRLGKQPLEVPGTGFHAASAHRPTLGGDAITGAFLTVRLPGLIPVEHYLRPGGDRAGWAFAGAFLAVLAEILQTEIDRPVMGQRHRRRDDTRFQPRTKEGMKDHFADPAHLSKATEQQEGRLQNIAVQHRVRLRPETEIADLPRDNAAEHREPKIGPHRLRNRNPVIARCPLHGLESLVNDHADCLVMRRIQPVSTCVMRIPGPVGASRHAHGIDAEEIARTFQLVAVPGRIPCRRRRGILPRAILQQNEGAKCPALGI